jgi:hypothetical protein
MSEAPLDKVLRSAEIGRAVDLLNEAMEIVDALGRPVIGARLQHVIDSLIEFEPGAFAA